MITIDVPAAMTATGHHLPLARATHVVTFVMNNLLDRDNAIFPLITLRHKTYSYGLPNNDDITYSVLSFIPEKLLLLLVAHIDYIGKDVTEHRSCLRKYVHKKCISMR